MSMIYEKIMVPLDGSDFSANALPHAQALAERFGAELVLFQAIQSLPRYMAAGEPGVRTMAVEVGPTEEDIMYEVEATKRALDQVADRLRQEGLKKVQTATEIGHAADSIVDYAADNKVDLIVMSTHGRTGLARWAFGSVATKVIQAATCPVLTIRPAEK